MVFAIVMLIKKAFLFQLLFLKEFFLLYRILPAGTNEHHQNSDNNKHQNVSVSIRRYNSQVIFLPLDSLLLNLGSQLLPRLTVEYCFYFLLVSFDIPQYHLIKITENSFHLSQIDICSSDNIKKLFRLCLIFANQRGNDSQTIFQTYFLHAELDYVYSIEFIWGCCE